MTYRSSALIHPQMSGTRPHSSPTGRAGVPRPSETSTVSATGAVAGGWLQRGFCGRRDPEEFFGPAGGKEPAPWEIKAKKICAQRCPVLADCRSWALANPKLTEFGVVGGMTESERRQWHKARAS